MISINKKEFYNLWTNAAKKMYIKNCMFPGCSNEAILSHALQNNGIISSLSEKGHVLMPVSQRDILFPNKNKDLYHKLNLVGKNHATTFYGFCKHHDTKIFLPIEQKDFTLSPHNLFLFAYRVVCAQLRNKQEFIKRRDLIAEKEDSLRYFNDIDPYYLGCQWAINDIFRAKKILDEYLLNKTTNPIKSLLFKLPKAKFASEGFIQPYTDFKGHVISDGYSFKNYPLFITVIPHQDYQLAIISWLKIDNHKLKHYIAQLRKINQKEKEFYITNIVLRSSDDLVLSPTLSDKIISNNLAFLFEGTQMYIQDEKENRFKNAGVFLEDWGINLFDL